LSSFSQIDTTKTALPNNILRLVAKDLVRYDGCKEELKLTQLKVQKLEEREVQKDTIISLYKEKDENNKYIIRQLELQVGQYEHLTDDLQKELKGQKVKSFLWKAGTFLGVITTSFLLLK
jgi:dolichyl-phosphate-mannose--protein O-mannosyl transferase